MLEGNEGQRAGGGEQVGDRHRLAGRVRQAGVARPVVHGRDAAHVRHEPQVAAVRRAPGRLGPAGHGGVRASDGADDGGVGVGEPGRELAAPPFHLDRVLAQPRVGGGCLGDGVFERAAGRRDVLPDRHAHAPLRRQPVGHRGGPVTRRDRAELDRDRQIPARHDRVLDRVALGFEAAQRGEDGDELLDGAHARGPPRCVRGASAHGKPEGERAAAAGGDVQGGGFGDDARVRAPAPAEHRVRAQAAVLFAHHRAEDQVAAQRDPSAAKARTVHSAATSPAFMSHAPRPYTASAPTEPENGT